MNDRNRDIKDKIIEAALPLAGASGWTDALLADASVAAGYSPEMARAVFAGGVGDALIYFAALADRRMIESLPPSFDAMKVREKIAAAVRARLDWLAPYKEAERRAIAFWAKPFRKRQGAKIVWRTADAIWARAGDTATDYNRYTKRILLSAVLVSTTLFWLKDREPYDDTRAFLDRRIENVLAFGKIVGRLKKA